MAIQLHKTAVDKSAIPVTGGVGYARPSLEVLSCYTCGLKGGCLIEQLTIAHDYSYQLVKNRKVLSRGDHVFRGGDDTNSICVVSEGSVKSYMLMEDGEEQVLDFHLPGDVFGLDAMGNHCHVSSVIALESTTICKLPLSDLSGRVLGQGFLNMISENILRDHNQMLVLASKDADGRMASFLVDMFKRTGKQGNHSDAIKLTMTRHDIANYLGLAIETVSRTLRRFQDSGILEVTQRKVKVFDFNCLLTIAGTQVAH